jgi:hypothetical protein
MLISTNYIHGDVNWTNKGQICQNVLASGKKMKTVIKYGQKSL